MYWLFVYKLIFLFDFEGRLCNLIVSATVLCLMFGLYEPRREKTGFLHMRKQRRRSASRCPRS